MNHQRKIRKHLSAGSAKAVCFVLLVLSGVQLAAQQLRVEHLQCDYQTNPCAVDEMAPRLSWQLQSSLSGTRQVAYRVIVSPRVSLIKNGQGDAWDSKKITGDASVQVPYQGAVLQAGSTYYWRVMVWDNHHHCSGWSGIHTWQMGLLTKKDWKGAKWIGWQQMTDSERLLPGWEVRKGQPAGTLNDTLPLLRKSFDILKKVSKATLYICGLGHFEASMNGSKIGDHFLDPGWTNYQKTALYVAFDVTRRIQIGENVLGVFLGNGFYYIPQVKKRYKKLVVQYGFPKMICRLAIRYEDGSTEDIVSDKSWKATPSPITFSGIYGGEDYNANLLAAGWNEPRFDDRAWKPAPEITEPPPSLKAQSADPLKVMQEIRPKQIFRNSRHGWIYDLGQNASGIPEITVTGKKGDTITIVPAELLHDDGTANQNATGKPYLLHYILNSDRQQTWHPDFTYYGFRYIEILGAVPLGKAGGSHLPVLTKVVGLHTRNSARQAGSFSCSGALFNKTFNLINWAIKSNMASVFTDCPHREKLGWLEELHLMGSSVRYNWQVYSLLKKVLADMRESQMPDGLVPEISPEFTVFTWGGDMFRDSPEWGSSSIIVPWYVYQWYGDTAALEQNYRMMKAYSGYLRTKSQNNLLYQGLGDWYDLGPLPPGVSQLTPKGLTATAIYYYDLTILQQAAALLHHPEDSAYYFKLAAGVKSSFNGAFFNDRTGQYGTGSQTADAMAVFMKLVPDGEVQKVISNLIGDLAAHGYALTAGDIGYRYVLRVLEDAGRSDVIFKMNHRSDVPGYGYQLAHGATALTESWQALPTVSNDHFMLGHLMEWFYTGILGIRQQQGSTAFHHILVQPDAVGKLTWAKGSYQSPYGMIRSAWRRKKNIFDLRVDIPANTDAVISLPATGASGIFQDGIKIRCSIRKGRAILKAGSGSYHFTVQYHEDKDQAGEATVNDRTKQQQLNNLIMDQK